MQRYTVMILSAHGMTFSPLFIGVISATAIAEMAKVIKGALFQSPFHRGN